MEPRDGALFPAAAGSFRAGLADRTYTGAVFFAVCRCGPCSSRALRPFVLRICTSAHTRNRLSPRNYEEQIRCRHPLFERFCSKMVVASVG